MNIGEAARRSGVSAKMIRHYELVGLINCERHGNNYRTYDDSVVQVLRFIRHARELAFSLWDIGRLLEMRRVPECSRVKALAQTHLTELERKAESLQAMAETLRSLTSHCPGDERPDCPILAAFADRSWQPQPLGQRHLLRHRL